MDWEAIRQLLVDVCGVPVVYREGDAAAIQLERADGQVESVAGAELDPEASASLFWRRGRYRRLLVTVPRDLLYA